jgi:E3 ubiquitin-protein ligase BOI-like protein
VEDSKGEEGGEEEGLREVFESLKRASSTLRQELTDHERLQTQYLETEAKVAQLVSVIESKSAELGVQLTEEQRITLQSAHQGLLTRTQFISDGLAESLARVERLRVCVSCSTKERSVLFLPCKHMCTCSECSTVDSCPLCSTPVTQRIQVHL